MQINKVAQRHKRHLAARKVTFRKLPYVLFDKAQENPVRPVEGPVIITGLANSGKTAALLELAYNLARGTPRPYKGKRHLLHINPGENHPHRIWLMLYSLMIAGAIGHENVGPYTAERIVREMMRGMGFDIVLAAHTHLMENPHYEIVHSLVDDMVLFNRELNNKSGFCAETVTLYRRENMTGWTGPVKRAFLSSAVVEVSKQGGMISGKILRSKSGPSGTEFNIISIKN